MILSFQVGPMTNEKQTQCFSTRSITVAGGFRVLPAPINWNYVFANADFAQNKAIYVTIIIIAVLYVILVIYARHAKIEKISRKVRYSAHCSYSSTVKISFLA